MRPSGSASVERRQVLDPRAIERAIRRMGHEIIEDLGRHGALGDLVLIGVRTRGVPLARRLAAVIADAEGITPPLGELDITLYRDDVFSAESLPVVRPTVLPFEIQGRHVVLVDDVLYTGRTTRAALDALMDYGRPTRIRLAVLIDRGHRELPLHADVVGARVDTQRDESVAVRLDEIDGHDAVTLYGRAPAESEAP
ncbi:MAG: bifunctional pyr operon transcriptional regulator/uracil phosphoribosyltransferase PyrR [bacterium]